MKCPMQRVRQEAMQEKFGCEDSFFAAFESNHTQSGWSPPLMCARVRMPYQDQHHSKRDDALSLTVIRVRARMIYQDHDDCE